MLGTIGRKLAGRDAGEVVALVAKNIVHAVRRFGPAAAASRRRDGAFDRRWGTETSGLVNLTCLDVDQARARHGVRYQPSSGDVLAHAVAGFTIDPAQWNFVDYGSGKGRVVLTAARAGFAQAVGVEFSPELVEIAKDNARRFVAAGGAAREPRFVLADAGAFEPPAGPLVAYLYNTFGPAVLDEVVAALVLKARRGDPVLVCYVDPRHLGRFAEDDWTMIERSPDLALLRAR